MYVQLTSLQKFVGLVPGRFIFPVRFFLGRWSPFPQLDTMSFASWWSDHSRRRRYRFCCCCRRWLSPLRRWCGHGSSRCHSSCCRRHPCCCCRYHSRHHRCRHRNWLGQPETESDHTWVIRFLSSNIKNLNKYLGQIHFGKFSNVKYCFYIG